MTTLVTGAAGFVGSHLVDRCLRAGHRVIGLDNLTTGALGNLSLAKSHDRFTFVEADVVEDWQRALHGALDGEALHAIIHCASPASPVDYAQRPLQTLAVNADGTRRCCETALGLGARLIFASTSEVYGDPLQHPQTESYWGNVNPIGPRSCYDESKRYGEALLAAYRRVHQLDARILRIFNTYGPRMRLDDGRVVPNFVRQALARAPLTVYGDGSQTRSFCFVDDLVEGIFRFAELANPTHYVINLGNPQEITILEFARTLCRLEDLPLRIERLPLPEDDPRRRCPDIARARVVLGWEPAVGLDDGLRRTIDHFKSMTRS